MKSDRIELGKTKKKLLKGTGIIIREDLTKSRVELLNDTISKFGLKQVWTESGKIYLIIDYKLYLPRINICTQDKTIIAPSLTNSSELVGLSDDEQDEHSRNEPLTKRLKYLKLSSVDDSVFHGIKLDQAYS
ncbi:hypothetical protein JTB14_008340 [Gonioctena quinquepunctata]|nr:hypothetical protein JTB14_008340 [Gonioctena quinquepunctata]